MLGKILSQASGRSEGDSLLRTEFELWLKMGEHRTPAQGRLFDVFLVNGGDEQVSVDTSSLPEALHVATPTTRRVLCVCPARGVLWLFSKASESLPD